MGRSVVLNPVPRCGGCLLPPRWCICSDAVVVPTSLEVDVLMHFMESFRPSSTGHLIARTIPAARQHVYRRERALDPREILLPSRELWLLHPNGEPLPCNADAKNIQALFLDGTWAQANGMARTVAGWGRRVRVETKGAGRYWLRQQAEPGRYSTFEALLFLLDQLGQSEAHVRLRLQFELHVFANLCARGQKQLAAEYLVGSPVASALSDTVTRLTRSRRDPPGKHGLMAAV